MTCRVGQGVVICDGQSGGWRVGHGLCPWCCVRGDVPVRLLYVWIYGGYGGRDCICGSCGFAWSEDDEWRSRMKDDHDSEEREANIAKVAAVPDPACWDCHDTGDCGQPGFDEPDANPCACAAGQRVKEAPDAD